MIESSIKDNLPTSLTWGAAFKFPLASRTARKEILIGGLLFMMFPPFGWIVNLGNRLNVIRRLYIGEEPFTGFHPFQETYTRGCISGGTILSYLFPGIFLTITSLFLWKFSLVSLNIFLSLLAVGLLVFSAAMFALPGCMVIYACENEVSVLLNPFQAFKRGVLRGKIYLKAWAIALAAITISIFGILLLGLGFFFLSVWAWQVAGYAFTLGIYSSTESGH
jgi:hypothetical protein